jgi:hypothetical protein
MNKKAYLKPEMQVVLIQHTGMLMISGQETVNGLESNMSQDDWIDLGGSDEDLEEVIMR